MKKILMSLLLLSSITLFAQNNDDHNRDQRDRHDDSRNNNVPDNVQRSFQQEYPDARDARWENTNGRWHSNYKDKDRDADAWYDNDGRRINTRYYYNETELPGGLRNRLHRRYHSDYKTYRVDRPGSGVLFQVTLGDGRVTYYDENGRKRRYRE